jgi:hypothetical protein
VVHLSGSVDEKNCRNFCASDSNARWKDFSEGGLPLTNPASIEKSLPRLAAFTHPMTSAFQNNGIEFPIMRKVNLGPVHPARWVLAQTHSAPRTLMGSMDAARRAGSNDASDARISTKIAAKASANGSKGLTHVESHPLEISKHYGVSRY